MGVLERQACLWPGIISRYTLTETGAFHLKRGCLAASTCADFFGRWQAGPALNKLVPYYVQKPHSETFGLLQARTHDPGFQSQGRRAVWYRADG